MTAQRIGMIAWKIEKIWANIVIFWADIEMI